MHTQVTIAPFSSLIITNIFFVSLVRCPNLWNVHFDTTPIYIDVCMNMHRALFWNVFDEKVGAGIPNLERWRIGNGICIRESVCVWERERQRQRRRVKERERERGERRRGRQMENPPPPPPPPPPYFNGNNWRPIK